jgi:hypothetical protein
VHNSVNYLPTTESCLEIVQSPSESGESEFPFSSMVATGPPIGRDPYNLAESARDIVNTSRAGMGGTAPTWCK